MNDVNKVMTYVVFKQKHTKVNVINANIKHYQCNHQYPWNSKETGPEAWELPVADEPIQGS